MARRKEKIEVTLHRPLRDPSERTPERLVELAEDYIRRLGYGTSGRIALESEPGWQRFLCFKKEERHWRLLLIVGQESEAFRDLHEAPLVNASSEVILSALKFMPALTAELSRLTLKEASEIRDACDRAEVWLKRLEADVEAVMLARAATPRVR